jgi:hypothetical protein
MIDLIIHKVIIIRSSAVYIWNVRNQPFCHHCSYQRALLWPCDPGSKQAVNNGATEGEYNAGDANSIALDMLSQLVLLFFVLRPSLLLTNALFTDDSLVKMLTPESFRSALEPNVKYT